MSYWSRIANVFRSRRVNGEIDEELESHIEEAIAQGRDPEEARRAFGSALLRREDSRDIKIAAWLDSLRSDAVFGWRQLLKNKVTSGAAVVSLALAIGACTSAFRLIDALLLRPLPVAQPDRLYFLTHEYIDREGKPQTDDSFEYPLFRDLRASVKDGAELLAISYANRVELTYASDHEMEKAYRQYVSGRMFGSFELKPAAGRLLSEQDDVKPGSHPYAVLSHDYWTRRFGRDPGVVGRTFRIGGDVYEIVGVIGKGFTGTETGTVTDIFVPTMMNAKAIDAVGWSWFRTWVRLNGGTSQEQVRQKLQAVFSAFRQERVKLWDAGSKQAMERYVNAPLKLEPGAAGVSGLQKNYRRSLVILGIVVLLVLLIACANVANLLTAQAASRAREMALRVSIGAGRSRLVQLLLVESALIAFVASIFGGLFAWWSAPFVVGMINPPDNPARLILPADWRVLGFAVAISATVTFLFGLAPALRASSVKPMSALKGGEDPHSRRRLMNGLIAAQVAFCFLVHFVAGLFVATFDRLSHEPLGFTAERLITLDTVAKGKPAAAQWEEVTEHLRGVPGVESGALSGWALMSGNAWGSQVWINRRPPEDDSSPYFLGISPGWLQTMRIGLIDGRDFRTEDTHPGAAIVSEAFAKRFFQGRNPVGLYFEQMMEKKLVPIRIVGYVRDARYRNLREPIRPTVYVPFNRTSDKAGLGSPEWATLVVRTAGDPLALASALRKEVPRARSEFRVTNIRTQTELVEQQTLRERLLAMLSLFFATIALVLAAVGLYGVLSYSVLQRRREIGIRMALGARAGDVARRVVMEVFAMLLVGAFAGLATGLASERFIDTLLYAVRPTDIQMLALPLLTIFSAAVLAALPPVIHAVRIDPAVTLRME
jgi:predicted permease